jgi:alpha-mannosidase
MGLALLNDGKYGHSCHGTVMGLSLLRGTTFPDPDADLGIHEFTYSLMPHRGDWQAAGVDHEAEALNNPLIAVSGQGGGGEGTDAWTPFKLSQVSGGATVRIEVAAVKPAERGQGFVLRLVETRGAGSGGGPTRVRIDWNIPIATVESVDLLERPGPAVALLHQASRATTEFSIKPFQIVSLLARRGIG